MQVIERLKNVKNKEYIVIGIIIFLIVIIALFSAIVKSSYAYYGNSNELRILSTKVGNFANKGDNTPLAANTDVNILYYFQDSKNSSNYLVASSKLIHFTPFDSSSL